MMIERVNASRACINHAIAINNYRAPTCHKLSNAKNAAADRICMLRTISYAQLCHLPVAVQFAIDVFALLAYFNIFIKWTPEVVD